MPGPRATFHIVSSPLRTADDAEGGTGPLAGVPPGGPPAADLQPNQLDLLQTQQHTWPCSTELLTSFRSWCCPHCPSLLLPAVNTLPWAVSRALCSSPAAAAVTRSPSPWPYRAGEPSHGVFLKSRQAWTVTNDHEAELSSSAPPVCCKA
jgi:hypothetical protein